MDEYRKSIAQFLQREEDVLLYTPDPSHALARAAARPWFGHYILEGQLPRLAEDIAVWILWFEHADCTVAQTYVSPEVEVSTVFLGLDRRLDPEGPPLLFETKIVGGPRDGDTWRYATWDEADAGHHAALQALREDPA